MRFAFCVLPFAFCLLRSAFCVIPFALCLSLTGDANHATLRMRVEEVERATLHSLAALRDSDRCQIAVVGTSTVQQADFLNELLGKELQAAVNDGKVRDQVSPSNC